MGALLDLLAQPIGAFWIIPTTLISWNLGIAAERRLSAWSREIEAIMAELKSLKGNG